MNRMNFPDRVNDRRRDAIKSYEKSIVKFEQWVNECKSEEDQKKKKSLQEHIARLQAHKVQTEAKLH